MALQAIAGYRQNKVRPLEHLHVHQKIAKFMNELEIHTARRLKRSNVMVTFIFMIIMIIISLAAIVSSAFNS